MNSRGLIVISAFVITIIAFQALAQDLTMTSKTGFQNNSIMGSEFGKSEYCPMPDLFDVSQDQSLENPIPYKIIFATLKQDHLPWDAFVEELHRIADLSEIRLNTPQSTCRTDVEYSYDADGLALGDPSLYVELKIFKNCSVETWGNYSYSLLFNGLSELNVNGALCQFIGFAPMPIVTISTGGTTAPY